MRGMGSINGVGGCRAAAAHGCRGAAGG